MSPAPVQQVEAEVGTRSIEIETHEVTRPDVTVSPDGEWLIFTALGHLFRLPVGGGTAQQLTFGPYYDSDPAISPDGQHVVFASDRDEQSDGNLFILELASGDIRQLTQETWAARPVWSPDGRHISYLTYEPAGPWAQYEFVAPLGLQTQVRRVTLPEGPSETLTEGYGFIHAVFYLADGRLAWAVVESASDAQSAQSRIDVMTSPQQVATLLTLEGVVDRVVPDPTGDGLYVRQYQNPAAGVFVPQPEQLVYVSLRDQAPRTIIELSNPQPRPQFSIANGKAYLGESGQLWQIDTGTGQRETIRFSASITMAVFPQSPPAHYVPEPHENDSPSSILAPRLSPDGSSLIFTAAGLIWQQPLAGGAARRLFDAKGFQWGPAALSPDGHRLAYQHSEDNLQELRVADLQSGDASTLLTVDRTGRFEPAWSPDGRQLVYVGFTRSLPGLYLADLETGTRTKIVDAFARWMPRPHFSADGASVYYTARNQIHRHAIRVGGQSEPITQMRNGHVADGLVSPDGRWLAFRRNESIWVAPLDQLPVTDASARRLTDEGGLNFSFAPDASAVIYAAGAAVWRQPLDGGERVEVPLQVTFPAEAPAAVLITDVRVLDFDAGSFTEPTSLLIDQGRIQWIGPQSNNGLPDNLKVISADGRYAIPGLFDMHVHLGTPIHFIPSRDVSRTSSLIAFGVTSVRDMGSDMTLLKAWTDRRLGYGDPVPRIFSGGAMLESTRSFAHGGSFFAETEAQARELVRSEKRDGAVAIKSYFTLRWPLHRAMADEARRQNIPVVSHGLVFREVVMGPVLGRASIEHQLTPIRVYSDVLQLLARTGTRWCVTIGVAGGNGLLFAQEPHILSCACVRAFTSQSDAALAQEVELFSDLSPAAIMGSYRDLLASLQQARSLGVKMLAGTDAQNPNTFYGHSLQMELRHLAAAGLAPLDILRMATADAAASLGAEDDLGTLTPGKLADLVLLDKNPLDDIKHTLSIWRVVQGGRVFASRPEVEAV